MWFYIAYAAEKDAEAPEERLETNAETYLTERTDSGTPIALVRENRKNVLSLASDNVERVDKSGIQDTMEARPVERCYRSNQHM